MSVTTLSLSLQRNVQKQFSLLMNKEFIADFQSNKKLSVKSFLQSKQGAWQFLGNSLQKRPAFYFLFFIAVLIFTPAETGFAQVQPSDELRTFIATAYYSPLPDQQRYYRGTYEADKALNGGGTHAADGTQVYAGMIAAPRGYDFGTKIDLQGLGVVSVHDRGGAILSASENGPRYDRIDIWMGYGDEGLNRTLNWGKREVFGKIVDKSTPVSLSLENVLDAAPRPLEIALQKLETLGYDTKNIQPKEVIRKFQLDYGVISSPNEYGAGNYGPKTTAKLAQVFANFQKGNPTIKTDLSKQEVNKSLEEEVQYKNIFSEDQAFEMSQSMKTVSIGQTAQTVVNLQSFLQKEGLYNNQIDGVMSLDTLGALRRYQYLKGLPQTGRVDIATQQFIRTDIRK